jgi:hypothetical protein
MQIGLKTEAFMKKIIISIAAIISVLLIIAMIIIFNGKKIFISRVKPQYHFDIAKAPPAPDYGKDQFWAALPTKKSEADLVPLGDGTDNQATARADVFYIHPTVYFRSENWNSPIDPESAAFETVRSTISVQASAFNGCCRVYAPQYREATLYSFMDNGDDGKLALDLAYGDVERAFDYYIKHYNQGRPFIIASHSQGTVHALRLLEEKIDRTNLYGRFIAGYLIGYRIPAEKFIRSFTRIKACSGERDAGCVLSWNTNAKGSVPRKLGFIWYRSGWENVDEKRIICTNPLSWKNDSETAPKEKHKGAVFPGSGGFWITLFTGRASGRKFTKLPAPVEHMISARCSEGVLYVPKIKQAYEMLGQGNYHIYDINLFYMNIRDNAAERVMYFIRRYLRK